MLVVEKLSNQGIPVSSKAGVQGPCIPETKIQTF